MPINRAFQKLKKPRKDGFTLDTIYSTKLTTKNAIYCT